MNGRQLAIEKLRAAGMPAVAVETFARQYDRLAAGEQGTIAERDIEPVATLPDAEQLPDAPDAPLDRLVVIKLNGGLGTSMGMDRAKSLLTVKNGLSFLDLIVRQVLGFRDRTGAQVPLVLMNSFATREDSLAALVGYPELDAGLPADFVQNRVPKLSAATLEPVSRPQDPGLEWVPPGHGDLYPALAGSGMLDRLLERGLRYAFVSNSDNLGAVVDSRILGWMARERHPFVMEATDRARSDRKGGHLALRVSDGQLVLREIAQAASEDLDDFQDIDRHRYFNTNSLWIDLEVLRQTLDREGVLDLPMIVNRKTVDPRDPSSEPVIQLETAMGAAIAAFPGAAAVRVDRSRYAPVKTTADLLAIRSDAYAVTETGAVALVPERNGVPPLIELDDAYKLVDDFEARFPAGPPSLIGCRRLRIEGDITFGSRIRVEGDVTLTGGEPVADGTVLSG
ncbi:MAG: UTP--glucose-1-phosphate uridylyltransferase [Baekduia sp.]